MRERLAWRDIDKIAANKPLPHQGVFGRELTIK